MTSEKEESWNDYYKKTHIKDMPWFTDTLDQDLYQELQNRKITTGRFLDLCTGPGTQAIALADLGFQVTGTDISRCAIEQAKKRSDIVDFRVNDIFQSHVKDSFDYIFDRGCFHAFPPEQRQEYVQIISDMLSPAGILFLKCFSIKEKNHINGPFRFSPQDIQELFTETFHIETIKETIYQGTSSPPPKSLFIVMKKKDEK
jgi:SAM-dependent methyltransferase